MITVLKDRSETGETFFHATLGERVAQGRTLGAAIDALAEEVSRNGEDEDSFSSSVIWVQQFKADRFFPEDKRSRLTALMSEWREARDTNTPFPEDKQAELEALVDDELNATAERTQAMLDRRK